MSPSHSHSAQFVIRGNGMGGWGHSMSNKGGIPYPQPILLSPPSAANCPHGIGGCDGGSTRHKHQAHASHVPNPIVLPPPALLGLSPWQWDGKMGWWALNLPSHPLVRDIEELHVLLRWGSCL